MNEIFTASTATFFYFLLAGSTIVYLILKFDTNNRQKLSKVLIQARDVEPMYMRKSAQHKVQALKVACNNPKTTHTIVEQQLDELVADFDKGNITLVDYCNRLNRLLAMTA
jgi:hypothetical protein